MREVNKQTKRADAKVTKTNKERKKAEGNPF